MINFILVTFDKNSKPTCALDDFDVKYIRYGYQASNVNVGHVARLFCDNPIHKIIFCSNLTK